jgi:hypothetical protein
MPVPCSPAGADRRADRPGPGDGEHLLVFTLSLPARSRRDCTPFAAAKSSPGTLGADLEASRPVTVFVSKSAIPSSLTAVQVLSAYRRRPLESRTFTHLPFLLLQVQTGCASENVTLACVPPDAEGPTQEPEPHLTFESYMVYCIKNKPFLR